MVVAGATLIVAPVPIDVPLHAPAYHLIDAPVPTVPPDTVIFVLPPAHMVGVVADADVGATDGVFTVMVTGVLDAKVPHLSVTLRR